MNKSTPKETVVANMNRPFETVGKDAIRSPLQRFKSSRCDHARAYKTDAYPTAGPTWVCVDCHRITDYPEDLD